MEYKKAKLIAKNEDAVSPVIAIILMVAITVVLAGVLYMWVISLSNDQPDLELIVGSVDDGTNRDSDHGCFFLIRAGSGTNINPARYGFYVGEKGMPLKKLDQDIRTYSNDIMNVPRGGDRNGTYDYSADGDLWNAGEYIGFDMPKKEMGIEIANGGVYEVMIRNPQGDSVFQRTFVYQEQY